jgi:hypothetical protein
MMKYILGLTWIILFLHLDKYMDQPNPDILFIHRRLLAVSGMGTLVAIWSNK